MRYALITVQPLDVLRRFKDMPEMIGWPNGDQTHAPSVGDERDGVRLVDTVRAPEPPGEFYHVSEITRSLDGATLNYSIEYQPNDLASTKADLCQRIDAAAEAQRQKYITPGNGQFMTYQEKLAQARACDADGNPDPATYPLLAAMVGIEGADVKTVAALVMATYAQWGQIAAAVEVVRLGTKAKIKSATTVDDAVAAFNAATWATVGT